MSSFEHQTELNAGTSQTPEFKGTYRSTILALLVLVYTFNFIDRMIVATLGQAIKVDLQITDAQLGLLQGLAFAIFFTTLGIPLGRLAERVSRVNIITVCLVLWSGMTALCGAAANYTQLFLYRMGVGIGEAGCSPPAHSLITDMYAARSRATALSIYSLGIPLGTMFGAMAGGWIADELGWRQAFLIVGLPGVVLAVVFKIVVKEPQRGLADGVRPDPAAVAPPLGDVVRQLFGNASFVHILVGATLIAIRRLRHRDVHAAVLSPRLRSQLHAGRADLRVARWRGGGCGNDPGRRRERLGGQARPALVRAHSRVQRAAGSPRLCPGLHAGVSAVGGGVHGRPDAAPLRVHWPDARGHAQPRRPADARNSDGTLIFVLNVIGLGAGPYVTGRLNDYFAEREFLRALGGSFAQRCPGGIAPAGSGDALVLECARSGVLGTRAGIVIMSTVLVWAALHYFLAARTLRSDLVTASARTRSRTAA